MSCKRSDSWASQLTKDQQYELYEKAKQPNTNWTKAIQWAVREYGLKKLPSQTAFYTWKSDMCTDELLNRIPAIMIATHKFSGMVPDADIIATFKVLATEAALNGDTRTAVTFAKCAAMLHDCHIKQLGIDQKKQAWKTEIVTKMANNIALAPYTEQLLKASSLSVDEMISDSEKRRLARTTPGVQPAAANPPAAETTAVKGA